MKLTDRPVVPLFFFGFLIAACSGAGGAPARDQAVASLGSDLGQGATVFANECADCHGSDGCGVDPLGPDLAITDKDEVIGAVLWGTGRMPPLGSTLDDQQVADVAAYVIASFTSLCEGDAGPQDAAMEDAAADATVDTSVPTDGSAMDGDANLAIDSGTDASIPTEVVDFCNCAILDCHDPFHARYGNDHDSSIAMCQTEIAETYAVAGSPQTSGRNVECLQSKCNSSCPADIFTTACVD